jgi:predicted nucleic acid-binding protein
VSRRAVIADAGPLIALARIDSLGLLRSLFGRVSITNLMRDAGDAVLLMMDDRAGRFEAKAQGIALIGTAALIGLAKTESLIPTARPMLEALVQSGYFIAPAVIAAVLADVGE